ncbi:MAG: DUF7557 family protein [Thermoplasmatota archaeon]
MLAERKSIRLSATTARRLLEYRESRESYDEILNELMDEVPPREFLAWHRRELRTRPRSTLAEVKSRLKL